MSYFKFSQNNSFGHYNGTPLVFIQADNAKAANAIAQDNGIYFNGVADGIDCDCCGDRWYPVQDDDALDVPTGYVADSNFDYIKKIYNDGDDYIDYSGNTHAVKIIKKK